MPFAASVARVAPGTVSSVRMLDEGALLAIAALAGDVGAYHSVEFFAAP